MSQEIPIYNFIIDLPSDVIDSVDQNGIDQSWRLFNRGEVVWTLQTHMILKEMGFQSTYSKTLKRNSINIAHVDTLKRIGPQKDCYVVAIRADKRPIGWSNYEIVQNMAQIKSHKQAYIPHWPQPGLIPRGDQRIHVHTVAYAGDPQNNCLTKTPIKNDLEKMGLTYTVIDQNNWNDFSQIDLLLAIRSFDGDRHDDKPPSKLINGWWGNVAVITSDDSAYRQIADPGEDYLFVHSYEELLFYIHELTHDINRYNKLIQNGVIKREKYTRSNIASDWTSLLVNIIKTDYELWLKKPRTEKAAAYNIASIKYLLHKKVKLIKRKYRKFIIQTGCKYRPS